MTTQKEVKEIALRPFGMLFAVTASQEDVMIDETGELVLITLECGTSQTCNEK